MEKLKAKLKKQGGFTLIEMLIVVAIIAILIAVSIPMVANALERTRDATDQANERAAKAEAAIVYLDAAKAPTGYKPGNAGSFKYDAENGQLVDMSTTNIDPYGKCIGCSNAPYENSDDHTSKIIKVEISDEGLITITWIEPSTTT